jgi:hypothetical protein
MNTAVLFAVRPEPALAALPRLGGQLAAGGVTDILILARPGRAAALAQVSLGAAGSVTVRESADAAADLTAVAEVVGAAGTPVLLVDADLLAHDSVISGALATARAGVMALTAPVDPHAAGGGLASAAAPVRVQRGRVIAAGSSVHRVVAPTTSFAGLMAIGPAHRRAAAAALAQAGESTTALRAGKADSLPLVLVALVRAGLPVRASGTAPLFCGPVTSDAERARAERALATADEDAARMRWAVKSNDDLFATYAVSSWSPRLVRLAARLGLSPTSVTWLSVVLALAAAFGFASGGRIAAVAGALLLYLSFALDCVDGQLARYTQRFSRFGGWLDLLADRSKEYVVFAGLAIGSAVSREVWPLAIAAITLQTVRHMTDGWYGRMRDEAVARLAPASFDQTTDPSARQPDAGGGGAAGARRGAGGLLRALAAATNSGRKSFLYWVKKLAVFPIGERFLVIALTAALFDGRTVFLVLLTFGGAAGAYTVAVRIFRARSLRAPSMSTVDVALHRDDGPLARVLARLAARRAPGDSAALLTSALAAGAGLAVCCVAVAGALDAGVPAWVRSVTLVIAAACLLGAALAGGGPHAGPFDWFVPGALRAAELSLIIGLAVLYEVPLALLYALLGVLVLYYYDLTARLGRATSPLVSRRLALGWDGRLVVLAAAIAAGQATLGFAALLAYLTVVFAVGVALGVRGFGVHAAGQAPRQRTGAEMADIAPRG